MGPGAGQGDRKENQRVRLTRELLTGALTEMLQERPIHAISIRELCERAGINRSTFYHHYGSQYDLLEDITDRFLHEIGGILSQADADRPESVEERVVLVLACLEENLTLSRLLIRNTVDPCFADKLFSMPRITDLLDQSMKGEGDPALRQAARAFAIHGSYRLLQEWIDRDERRSPSEEAALILALARRVCQSEPGRE